MFTEVAQTAGTGAVTRAGTPRPPADPRTQSHLTAEL